VPVRFHRIGLKRLHHLVVGDLELNFEARELPSQPGLTMFEPVSSHSGRKVSRIALGCMSFGDPAKKLDWSLETTRPNRCCGRPSNSESPFWDTTNIYGLGTSEEIVGRALAKYTNREEIVLATKLFMPMSDGPGGSGLSRKAWSRVRGGNEARRARRAIRSPTQLSGRSFSTPTRRSSTPSNASHTNAE
jgi:hypothetical protein